MESSPHVSASIKIAGWRMRMAGKGRWRYVGRRGLFCPGTLVVMVGPGHMLLLGGKPGLVAVMGEVCGAGRDGRWVSRDKAREWSYTGGCGVGHGIGRSQPRG